MSGLLNNSLFLSTAAAAGGYQIERSLRFNSSDSAFCSRTPAVSFSGPITTWFTTSAVFRDCSAWVHIVLALDTTQATAADRIKLYVNGSQVTAFSTSANPSQNADLGINQAAVHGIGAATTPSGYIDGYLADIHFIDGQALTPSSFTEVSATTGQLIPIEYTGTFGTNGFHLPFSDNSAATAATLGADTSGNGNNWTPNNFSVVAGGPTTITTPASNAPPTVDYLVVGGGGGAGGDLGGGGGAGGFRTGTGFSVNAGTTYTITIGAGGAGNTGSSGGTNGGDSVFSSITSTGGGGGGGDSGNQTGLTGGSGGGCSSAAGGTTGLTGAAGNTPASSSPPDTNAVQGFKGGDKVNGVYRQSASGGGGASQAGEMAPSNSQGGKGGDGSLSSITGSPVTYAGGGGGGSSTTGGAGGAGGGGAGTATSIGTAGTVNLGGGGGGAGISGGDGAAGGSGIVIIRYTNTYADLTVGGGLTYTYANTGGYKIYSFTASATAAQSAGNDSLVDTPTSIAATDTGVGGEIRGNYATFNALALNGNTLSNGNLDYLAGSANKPTLATIGIPNTGKWYFEFTDVDSTGSFTAGVGSASVGASSYLGADANGWGYQTHPSNAGYHNSGVFTTTGRINGAGSNTILGVAIDRDTQKIWFSVNGTYVNSGVPASGTNAQYSNLPSSGELFPGASTGSSQNIVFNAGQRAFAYTAPSGFKALCDTNLGDPLVAKPNTVMDVALWTGTGVGARAITGLNFNPDLVWLKRRSSTGTSNQLHDVVRTASAGALYSDLTNAEDSNYPLTSFDTAGFTLGSSASLASQSYASQNETSQTYVGWTWDAGTSTVTNTAGSITSQVRANVSAGFSICTFSIVSASATISTFGHGLGVAPSFVIFKVRNAVDEWTVYHGSISSPTSNWVTLNTTNAAGGGTSTFSTSSTTFGVRETRLVASSGSGNILAYCFAPVDGYSSFGSYVGNGSSDGPMVWTGFRPRYILIKCSAYVSGPGTLDWAIYDTSRSSFNVADDNVWANLSDQEYTSSSYELDILSNGFKLRNTHGARNGSGSTYIYAAFAENPFQYARAR
jgi:hypothetical protein